MTDGSLEEGTALLMTGLLHGVTGACRCLVFVLVLFVQSAMSTGKPYLAIVDRLAGQADADPSG